MAHAVALALAVSLSLWCPNPAQANLDGADWIFHHNQKEYRFSRLQSSRGTPWIRLSDLARRFELKLRYDPRSFQYTLTENKSGRQCTLSLRSKQVLCTSFSALLSRIPEMIDLEPVVTIDFGDRVLRPLLTGVEPLLPLTSLGNNLDVVLDPGHGGNDLGARWKTGRLELFEKDLVLSLAQDLRAHLQAKGLKVGMTRTQDTFLTLPERTQLANQSGAQLFLSIHLNFDPQRKRRGYEIYLLSLKAPEAEARAAIARENQGIPEELPEGVDRAVADLRAEALFEASLEWAKLLQHPLRSSLPPASPKPIRMGPFYVLYGSQSPALLLELGYLSSADDRNILLSPQARQALLQQLSQGLAERLKKGITTPHGTTKK
jgi:N-acetylmuramoyl-L-alanine amidase